METKLDVVIGNHADRISNLEDDVQAVKRDVRQLDRARWLAVGSIITAVGSGAASVFALFGG